MKKLYYALFLTMFIASCSHATSTILYPICKEGLFGYIDSSGHEVVKPRYLYASDFKNGMALVVVDTMVRTHIYSSTIKNKALRGADSILRILSGTFIPTAIAFKYGYIDGTGKIIVDTTLIYEQEYSQDMKVKIQNRDLNNIFTPLLFNDNRAVFMDEANKYGFIDKAGNVVIAPQYIRANRFREGIAMVALSDEEWQYIDVNGNRLFNDSYSYASDFWNGYACVKRIKLTPAEDSTKSNPSSIINNVQYVIDKKGNIVVGPMDGIFINIYGYQDGCFYVAKGFGAKILSWNFMDINGDYLLDNDVEDITRFENGFAGVCLSDKWVFIDSQTKIHAEYENLKPFNKGIAAVKENGKWGYIDTTFEYIIPPKYDTCSDFNNTLAKVQFKQSNYTIDAYINKRGEVVWQTGKWDL